VRSEIEIRKRLKLLKENKMVGGPYSELKSIAWHGTKQALEWVLEETETPLTYS
jgi:hypothetical protein